MSTDGTGPDAAEFRDEAPQYALPLVIRVERASPPRRTDALEAAAQVAGTELTDDAQPPSPLLGTPVLWLNPSLPMTAGKAMAQVGHGAHLTWWRLPDVARMAWVDRGFDLAVRTASPWHWAGLLTSDLPVVRDGGFTEVAPGSATVIADHPALR